MNTKYCGISLLFVSKIDEMYEAQLKSYIIQAENWEDVKKKKDSIVEKETDLDYVGIADIFSVSGEFEEMVMLGKSFIDECTSLKEAKEMLANPDEYSFIEASKTGDYDWLIVSLIYFYEDKAKNDKLAISCNTVIRNSTINDLLTKIKTFSNNQDFKNKILNKTLDEMNPSYLKFVGVEDIGVVRENPITGGAFQIFYSESDNLGELKEILPTEEELLSYKWSV